MKIIDKWDTQDGHAIELDTGDILVFEGDTITLCDEDMIPYSDQSRAEAIWDEVRDEDNGK